ncbi:hypothetical protein RIR_e31271_A0A2I1FPI5_9GLOM [Rhizophagus irregularis DAOM 181602=DAOM 197198]|nr:hypothetical protein RhiirB3_458497 [Rhizophagus irregularis]GET59183.1 hypothetical protein RIR_e31271_A0A2I1FPI5_9GLOM [Rhizophagus irregularis DAOM 181602=DAOM 197198]
MATKWLMTRMTGLTHHHYNDNLTFPTPCLLSILGFALVTILISINIKYEKLKPVYLNLEFNI